MKRFVTRSSIFVLVISSFIVMYAFLTPKIGVTFQREADELLFFNLKNDGYLPIYNIVVHCSTDIGSGASQTSEIISSKVSVEFQCHRQEFVGEKRSLKVAYTWSIGYFYFKNASNFLVKEIAPTKYELVLQ